MSIRIHTSATALFTALLLSMGGALAQCTDFDVVVGGGSAESEIHWELVDPFGTIVAQGDAPENTGECLPAGCYTMYMYDDGNNGWNGGTWTVYLQNTTTVVATGTLVSGGYGTAQVDLGGGCGGTGCSDQTITVTAGTDPADVNWELYDQFGNLVEWGGAPYNLTTCLPDGCYVMYLYDQGADGWNGAVFTVTDVASGTVQATGTLSNGGFATMQVIIGAGCGSCDPYTLTVSAGTAPAQVSWELYDASFMMVASGSAPTTMALCLSPGCYTLYQYDSGGNGWNGANFTLTDQANITVATGTLVSGSFGTTPVSVAGGCSTGSCSTYTMTVTSGSAPAQVSWNFMSMGMNQASGGAPATVSMCLDTGCYVMQMYDAGANGWNGATWTLTNSGGTVVGTGTLASGANGATAVPLGTGPCSVPQVVTASDCPDAVDVCTDLNFTIDPSGWGAIWEIPALGSTSNPDYWVGDAILSPWGTDHYGCLMGQEINTTWMIVNIATGGTLEFTLGANGAQSGFYDWTMFPYTPSTCSSILANTIAPVRCNWNYASYGGTGLTSVVPAGGVPENYEPPLVVSAGQRYIICFSNWSSVTTVVPLVFGGSATVSCDPIVLPVELVSLTAKPGPWAVDLAWTTATEDNTAYFTVERSTDLWSWEPIGEVAAAGLSTVTLDYGFPDRSPLERDMFYRLAITDLDGTVRRSAAVRAHWSAPLLHCWPNPNTGTFTVELGHGTGPVQLAVFDAYGHEVPYTFRRTGDDEAIITLPDASPGAYHLRVWQDGQERTTTVLVQRP